MDKVTIKTVAEHAGVSIATVSRAMSGSTTVAPELRKAVESSARTLGYARNSIASALRSSKTQTVGMVVPEIANPFVTDLVQEVEDALHAAGYQLLLCNAHQDPVREREALASLIARQVDGLIISPVDSVDSLAGVRWATENLRLVQVDQRIEGLEADWVGVDDEQGMRLVLEHLAAQGIRSAAFIGSIATDSSSMARLDSFRKFCQELHISIDPDHIKLGDYTASFGREATTALAANGALPDALVCAADIIAIGALQTCHQQGIGVPSSLMVTGFDDIEFADLCTPQLTTVRQPLKAIAQQAVKLVLTDHVPHEATARTALSARLVERHSTGQLGLGIGETS
ncbi:LacI family DNA-binding transcriptional regulator [Paeniglutamicibacter sp. MACA_103]|uniref:LacI family DNA-binding transcriptional regulator n=1 Tax=Paeniglutamicibacter sp. MACA_103 TaxID=3377337 RepID=UPI0038950571